MMHIRWGRLYQGTPAELSLEDAIAELGVPYRNNFPGFKYGVRFFPDFYLPTLKLVMEVDDKSHRDPVKQTEDELRSRALRDAWGVRVVRCTNEEALSDPRGAVRAMLNSVGMWPLPTHRPPLAAALPQLGAAPRKARRERIRRAVASRPKPATP